MPKEVAIELLVEPKNRLTNRMRKNCHNARVRCFISDAERKPAAGKVAAKLKGRSLAWIGREIERAKRRRAGLQHRYLAIVRQLEATGANNALLLARVAEIDRLVTHLDTFRDCAETELEWRK